MREDGKRGGWGLLQAILLITFAMGGGCGKKSDPQYCDSDSECSGGQVCGTTNCQGTLRCVPAACACTQGPGSISVPGESCLSGSSSSCSCDRATCQNPFDSCGEQVCPGVCEIGESCDVCLESEACELVNVCRGSWCLVDGAGEASCRPLDCLDDVLLPPLCGSPEAPCGEACCEPACTGRQCGMESVCGTSCGACEPYYLCSDDYQCVLDPEIALCEGELRTVGPVIEVEHVNAEMPLPQGGIIEDGTYDLVATRQYDELALVRYYARSALRFFEGATRAEQFHDGVYVTTDYAIHRLMTVTAAGTDLQFRFTCPDFVYPGTGNLNRGFTVQGSELLLFQSGMVEVYSRRP